MSIRIGISGWTYAPWRGVFYPPGLAQRRELAFAAHAFPSIEINGTHYSLQKPESFRRWFDETPDNFVFSIKGSRYITHMRRLRDVGTPLANFFASGLLALGEKLGPLLWQLPPSFAFDAARLRTFLEMLPRDTAQAGAIARRHDDRLRSRARLKVSHSAPLRHCFEVRHPSFLVPEFFDLLRQHGAAFVLADSAGKFPYAEEITADFAYVRLHGAKRLYESGYTDAALNDWTARIRAWTSGRSRTEAPRITTSPATAVRDVFVYFDNDIKVHAPFNARRLAEKLAVKWRPDGLTPRAAAPRHDLPPWDTSSPSSGS